MTSSAGFGDLATRFADTLSTVEDSLYQTRNQSGQDPLNYPIRLNDQMGGLQTFISRGERRPPKQSYEVFDVLSPKLDVELMRLEAVIDDNLPRINAMLRAAGVPEIVRSKVERARGARVRRGVRPGGTPPPLASAARGLRRPLAANRALEQLACTPIGAGRA